ncbi:DUF4258 domain-containing protein [Bacteriovorax sp. BSW11_IV]|uniref:DUF4258 domain-containing protein n=1 Tax=Bacteriovorax sp. BSW11_IV TaxID=1353529 RepID=UPI000415FA40|nr:hypothetical protein [Bacteriovorax sp. BSW11_IV]
MKKTKHSIQRQRQRNIKEKELQKAIAHGKHVRTCKQTDRKVFEHLNLTYITSACEEVIITVYKNNEDYFNPKLKDVINFEEAKKRILEKRAEQEDVSAFAPTPGLNSMPIEEIEMDYEEYLLYLKKEAA